MQESSFTTSEDLGRKTLLEKRLEAPKSLSQYRCLQPLPERSSQSWRNRRKLPRGWLPLWEPEFRRKEVTVGRDTSHHATYSALPAALRKISEQLHRSHLFLRGGRISSRVLFFFKSSQGGLSSLWMKAEHTQATSNTWSNDASFPTSLISSQRKC